MRLPANMSQSEYGFRKQRKRARDEAKRRKAQNPVPGSAAYVLLVIHQRAAAAYLALAKEYAMSPPLERWEQS